MEEKVTPEYGEKFTDSQLESYFKQAYKDSDSFFGDLQEEWEQLYDAYWGETLTKEDREWLKDTMRPPVSLNLAIGTINTILGSDQSERKEVQWKGVDLDEVDRAKAEILTRVHRYYYNRGDGFRYESDAILDLLITGYGWMNVHMDTTRIPIPPVPKAVPVWEMRPDPNAIEAGLADAQFMIRRKRWTLERAQSRWPSKKDELAMVVTTDKGKSPNMFPSATVEGDWRSSYGGDSEGVEINEFQYIRYEPRTIYMDPLTQKKVDQSLKEWKERAALLQGMHDEVLSVAEGMDEDNPEAEQTLMMASQTNPELIQRHEYAAKRFYRAYIASDLKTNKTSVLEHFPIEENAFSYVCATGYPHKQMSDGGRVSRFGPMRTLYDTQLYVNRSASVIIDILGKSSKGGGLIEKDAVVGDFETFRKERSTPGNWSIVESGAIGQGKIMETSNASMPSGFEQFLNMMSEMMAQITGVTEYLKGTATQERSNVLISNLQQQSLTMLNPLFDSIALLRITVGKAMANLIVNYVDEEDINAIIGNLEIEGVTVQTVPMTDPMTGQPVVDPMTGQPQMTKQPLQTPGQLIKQSNPQDFDVVADLGAASPTHRQAVWQVMYQTNLLPQLIELLGPAAQAIIPELVRYLPVPAEWAKKLGDMLETSMQQQAQGMMPQPPPGGMPGAAPATPPQQMPPQQQGPPTGAQ